MLPVWCPARPMLLPLYRNIHCFPASCWDSATTIVALLLCVVIAVVALVVMVVVHAVSVLSSLSLLSITNFNISSSCRCCCSFVSITVLVAFMFLSLLSLPLFLFLSLSYPVDCHQKFSLLPVANLFLRCCQPQLAAASNMTRLHHDADSLCHEGKTFMFNSI